MKHNLSPTEVRQALEQAGTKYGAAKLLGVGESSIRRACNKYHIEWEAKLPREAAMTVDDLLPPAEKELSEDEKDAVLVGYLQEKGYCLSKDVRQENRQYSRTTKTFDGHSFKVGVVSDTHFCSKYQQLTHLHTAYDVFESEGIDTVLHTGDVTAGNGRMYRGQQYEVHVLGYDKQRKYVRDNYPKKHGIQTLVIAGNHDASWTKSAGANIVEAVCNRRDDMSYLGQSGAFVELHGINFYLMHPTGGVSYARSYKLQKLIEQMAPENKPHIFLSGHFHVTCTLKQYRNVYGMLLPCFESQTPYLLEKGLYPEVGFTILKVTVGEPGDLVKVADESLPFFVPNAEDY